MSRFWTLEAIDRALFNHDQRIKRAIAHRDFWVKEVRKLVDHPERDELLMLREQLLGE